MKNKKYLFLSFLIPFLIYFTIFYINGFFTSKLIIQGDSAGQYYPLFNYLKGLFDGTNSLFYSFSKGLGGPMFGTFFYYLSSPFNILLSLINKGDIINFMTIIMIVKLSLCSFTMYIYMHKKFKDNSLVLFMFSLLYSFLGYNLNYFLNVMWLDIVLMAPLVLLGIDNIINHKSPILYMVFLTHSIVSNYYISYMLCIFAVIYFLYEVSLKYCDKGEIKELAKTFLISSLLSGMMCAIFLIPCIIEMLSYGRGTVIKDIFTFDFNIFNLLAGTYIGSVDMHHPFNTYYINLYCGIITIPLVFLYLKNKDIPKKKRKATLITIVFMLLPCFIGVFNWIWHLFSLPIGFYFRYSFLLCLFMLRITYESYKNLSIKKTDILSYLAVYLSYSAIIMFIIYFKNYYPNLNYYLIWITNIFLVIYLVVLFKCKRNKDIIIFSIILVELILNVGILMNNKNFDNRESIIDSSEIIEKYKNDQRINVETDSMTGNFNDSFTDNYYSTSIFLSTTNSNSIDLLYKLGANHEPIATGVNTYFSYNKISYIANALLGVETIISRDDNLNYELIDQKDGLYIYKNPNALSLGYIVNNCDVDLSFPYDEKILNCLSGNDYKYYKEYTADNGTYEIKKGYYYIYLPDVEKEYDYFIKKLGNSIQMYNKDYIFVENKNDNLNLNFNDLNIENIDELKVYYFDNKLVDKGIENLKDEQLDYTISNNSITGSIDTKGGLLLITIPLDKGIKVYVDEQEVKPELVLNALIGIELKEGYHNIKVTYEQPGIKIGTAVSLISLLLSIFYLSKKQYTKK